MPGVVLEVLVSQGTQVERNQTVMVMESMKMELVITAPRSGVVRRVSVDVGDQVDKGMRLLELGSDADTDG
jgi:biotin carboxyl carrier protein